ncbi:hypothetical protein BLNAU_16208 [Blattamonas nauphoetae]|uniref:Uncharacterized protein n=1 Tax=Blattamonas nauphoetae TaxID=2049346 RepID=A0ABQ9XF82_9EUKA|nr:hypothetical protein BLNAU_16208 [Blattamonas nauphoetae]
MFRFEPFVQTDHSRILVVTLSREPSLATHEQPLIWTQTIEIDDEEHDHLLVCADISETDESMLTVDRMILASECTPDQNFVFTTPFSFPTSDFSNHPIGVVASSIVVVDGVVGMGRLDEDDLRQLWTSWNVSELSRCLFTDCSANRDGGSIFVENHNSPNASIVLEVCSFADCPAERGGGFIINTSAASSLTLGRSPDPTGPFKHIHVENTPLLILATDGNAMDQECSNSFPFKCHSISSDLPLFHTRHDNDGFFPIPILMLEDVYFFETGHVSEQWASIPERVVRIFSGDAIHKYLPLEKGGRNLNSDFSEIPLQAIHLASFANTSSTDTVPSIVVLISSAGQIFTNTTMIFLQHITQLCPERLPPHLDLRDLKSMDRIQEEPAKTRTEQHASLSTLNHLPPSSSFSPRRIGVGMNDTNSINIRTAMSLLSHPNFHLSAFPSSPLDATRRRRTFPFRHPETRQLVPIPTRSPSLLRRHSHHPTPLCLSLTTHTLPLPSASPSPPSPSHSPLPLPHHPHTPTPLCLSLTTLCVARAGCWSFEACPHAPIDSFNSASLLINACFSSCSSLTGSAGAIKTVLTQPDTFKPSTLLCFGNTAFGTTSANDIHLVGASFVVLNSDSICSSSATPSIVDKDGTQDAHPITYANFVHEDDLYSLVLHSPGALTEQQFIDILQQRMSERSSHFSVHLSTSSDHPLCLPPLVADESMLELTGLMGRSHPLIAQTTSTSGPLFAII